MWNPYREMFSLYIWIPIERTAFRCGHVYHCFAKKSSHPNTNPCNQEFCMRPKKFPLQGFLIFKITWICHILSDRKLQGLKWLFCLQCFIHLYAIDSRQWTFFRCNFSNVSATFHCKCNRTLKVHKKNECFKSCQMQSKWSCLSLCS